MFFGICLPDIVLFFGGIGPPEIILIFLVILILFGAKRIPDIAQGIGRGIRDFRKALKDSTDEIGRIDTDNDKSKPDSGNNDKSN
ncbi:MAG: twin-arginine translocase TatA/TatE family subunit [candidate division Zixibacteria bacterium]|nr:twin-arginine translocase TatA/TatE family subunit [candidate division Zixibacteria bacterium]